MNKHMILWDKMRYSFLFGTIALGIMVSELQGQTPYTASRPDAEPAPCALASSTIPPQ